MKGKGVLMCCSIVGQTVSWPLKLVRCWIRNVNHIVRTRPPYVTASQHCHPKGHVYSRWRGSNRCQLTCQSTLTLVIDESRLLKTYLFKNRSYCRITSNMTSWNSRVTSCTTQRRAVRTSQIKSSFIFCWYNAATNKKHKLLELLQTVILTYIW